MSEFENHEHHGHRHGHHHHEGRSFERGPLFGPGADMPEGGPRGQRPGRGPRGGFGPNDREGFGPERGEGHRRGGRSRGGRASRGDVRAAVLTLLGDEPMHGYQLMQTISDRTGGQWRPSPGAIYPTISQLEDEGLVNVTSEGGRKLVTLTDAGRAHVAEHSAHWPNPFNTDDQSGVNLRQLAHELMEATRQVGRGTIEQRTAAGEVLSQARRSLYLILAGERPAKDDAGTDTDI